MLFDQIARNKRRTWVLLFAFFLLTTVMGGVWGYVTWKNVLLGVFLGFLLSGVYLFITSLFTVDIVMSLNKAEQVDEKDYPTYYHIVEDMAMVAQVPMPKVYVIDDPSPNAFATGFQTFDTGVAATTGLLELLNREELESVMGHEVAHIRNLDIRISALCVAMTSALDVLADMTVRRLLWGRDDDDDGGFNIFLFLLALLVALLAPFLGTLLQLAISRQREFLADATSVEFTRNPRGMISALQKLEQGPRTKRRVHKTSKAMYINAPLRANDWEGLFRTHPPIPKRVAALQEMLKDYPPLTSRTNSRLGTYSDRNAQLASLISQLKEEVSQNLEL